MQMADMRQEIEEILADCNDEDEQLMGWEATFDNDVAVPFQATLLGIPVEVQGFRANNSGALQCRIEREGKQRWIGVTDLDDEGFPEDFLHVMKLYRAWLG